MSRVLSLSLALLAGASLIWLVQVAAVAVFYLPGILALPKLLRESGLPPALVMYVIQLLLPAFGASLLVGLVGFRLPERKGLLFLCLFAPFAAFSLSMNIGLYVWAGNSWQSAFAQPYAWLVVCSALLGIGAALLLSSRKGAAS